jgi:O-antigen/teichoic acid export membrane protein
MAALAAGAIDSGVISTVAARVVMVGGAGLAALLTTHFLTPAQRGEYFVVYTLAQGLAQFGNFGLQSSNTYFVAHRQTLGGALLANTVWLSAAAGLAGAALVAFTPAWGGVVAPRMWIAPVLAPAMVFYVVGGNLLVGLKRIAAFNAYQVASNGCVVVCLAAAAALGAGPAGFLLAIATGWTVVAVSLFRTLRRTTRAPLTFRPDVFRDSFRYGLKAYVATAGGFLVIRSSVFLLSAFGGAEQVGYYSLASQLAEVVGIVPQSMALVLFPALITATSGRFRTMMQNLLVLTALLGAGCAAIAIGAEPGVRLVFGARFLPAVPMLRWMLPGVFFLGLTAMPSQYLAAVGFPVSLVLVWICGSVVAAVSGWFVIPLYGGMGAAAVMSVIHCLIFLAVLALAIARARADAADVPAPVLSYGVPA